MSHETLFLAWLGCAYRQHGQLGGRIGTPLRTLPVPVAKVMESMKLWMVRCRCPSRSARVDDNSDAWPLNNGKANRHTKFVQPEQIEDLAELMCRKNYAENDIRGILGENFRRVCKQVWK